MTRAFDLDLPLPTQSCPRGAIVALAHYRDYCNSAGAERAAQRRYCNGEPSIEACCGAWAQPYEEAYASYESVRRRRFFKSPDPKAPLVSRSFEWSLQELTDDVGNIVQREVIKQQPHEFNLDSRPCHPGVQPGLEFWEWEPEGRLPRYEEQGKWGTARTKPGIEKMKLGKEGNAIADYDKRREWFKERLAKMKLWKSRLLSKLQRSEYNTERKRMAAEQNWVNLFTNEPPVKYGASIPRPDQPGCPTWGMKELAELGKHLKNVENVANVANVPKEDAKWAVMDTYASELFEKGMCRDEILVVLDRPNERNYSSYLEWWSERRKWKKYNESLEKGEDVPLPKLQYPSSRGSQHTQDQLTNGGEDPASDDPTATPTKGKRAKDFSSTRLDTIVEVPELDDGMERGNGDDFVRDEEGAQDKVNDHGDLETIP
ncbi:uncharacterized protein Z519_07926 [Cladophialophora bantiana CBS 173.52]|uniref:Uncharacterized protein n=1 Tax=Cladophialophora bantiana (strain ATCC 10958 / CBS 173.52 / CDC B-1940 / NIH 8579) TaxID=1442370 RepID=A0A0D2FX27_CLAB1|nr:uncharacterized protein Z519_07926 [Cladophialophora bantiana CBS 173.52]KIW91032.1 hypothetical protein Z519_07926 [Cladophialophora bantiana CBS 173.52]